MKSWDYIVIGAGSAGAVMANRLSAPGGGRVLVLEAGARQRDIRFKVPVAGITMKMNPMSSWCFWSEPEPGLGGRSIEVPRGKGLGGSSLINGGVYNRGNPVDFDHWAELGSPGWDFASVLPHFRRVENHWAGETAFHGAAGEIFIRKPQTRSPFTDRAMQAAKDMGFSVTDDIAGADPEGFHIPDFNVDDRGRRHSTVSAFLDPVRGRSTLDIETNASVSRIVIENGRAVAVEYVRDGKTQVAHADREIILSAGTMKSPHLLMLSGVGPADHLREHGIEVVHDLPGVGQNLHDQPACLIVVRTKEPRAFHRTLRADRFAVQCIRWVLGMRNELASMPVVAAANMRTLPGANAPDMRIMISALTLQNSVWFPGIRAGAGHLMMSLYAVPHPRSRGTITLKSADPRAAPSILFNILTDPHDRAELRRGHRIMRDYLAQPALASVVGDTVLPPRPCDTDAEIDTYHRSFAQTTAHPMGTCKMGSDSMAVVDADCKVRGIDGLRVVDLSVVPVQSSGNPHGTAVMMADKVSHIMLGRKPLVSQVVRENA